QIEQLSASALEGLTPGEPIRFKDGVLMGITGNSRIYVIEHGKKRHIASEAVFNGLGYKWNNILWTDVITGGIHETGVPVFLRQDAPAPQAPKVVAGKKEQASSPAESSIEQPKTNAGLPTSQRIEEGAFLSIPET